MTSVPGMRMGVHLECTIRTPNLLCEESTPFFSLLGQQYYFCLEYMLGEEVCPDSYALHLRSARNRELFSLSFDISVCVVKGPKTYFRENKHVTWVPFSVWNMNVFDIEKKFDLDTSLIFSIDICHRDDGDCSPNTDDKTTQTLSYLDNYFDFEALSSDFAKLLDGSCSPDVEITCGDRNFKVHKNILSTRSEVFAAMLQSSMVEGRTGRVTIQDMESDLFQQFLHYLYSGVLPVLTVSTARIFYVVADKYSVVALKKQCASFLSDSLTRENACETLILADQHSDANFRDSIIAYILQQKILLSEDPWEDFCKNQPELSLEVYKRFCKIHHSQ